ncbi:MAG: Do family serine endopeptidase [Treponema sp.]|jgi:Do/DeqQ family serine protease|nr:Do family serine endopeptidase [Treponema sp.]
MNLLKKLSSKSFLFFNLVLVGVIFGFTLACFSFFGPMAKLGKVAQAEQNQVMIPESALAVAESLQAAIQAVSAKVVPSVVEIDTVSVVQRQSQNYNGVPWEFFFGPQEDQGQSEYRSQGLGSGIIVRKDRDTYYVLTNYHVVEDVTEITIKTDDGKEAPASLVGTDERKDLAMVSFKSNDSYPLAVLGDSDAVKVGDWAIAVGNPLSFMSSVTMGIISAVGRTDGPANNINDFIQTDASINQGNSGGPLVNIRGEVIGINTWIVSNSSSSGGSIGIGFAIPINNTKRSIDEFINTGTISYGWLGVSLIEPDRDSIQALKLDGKRGGLAAEVFIGSPADKGGIKPGDFITHVNGKEARGSSQVTLLVGELKPGDQATFTVIRDGTPRDFTVRIEARTDEAAADSKNLWPGVYVVPLTDARRSSLKLDQNAQGVYVYQTYAEAPAAVIGLQRGDLITGINGQPVKDLASFYQVLRDKTDKELWFNIIRNSATMETMRFKR